MSVHTKQEPASSHNLQITLTDIAQLAHVQRPVVSMWRSRSRNTDTPFPLAVATHGRQELFDAAQVTDWLSETGRGNNPHAADDAPAFAAPFGPETRRIHFAELTALIALRALLDLPLGQLGREDLLDAADELDPDDEFLFTELEGLGANLLPLAAYADLLTDAAYTAAAAFEQVLGDRFRSGPSIHARTLLSAETVELLASTAVELAVDSVNPPVFMDDGGSDFLLAVADILGESGEGVLCVGTLANDAARLARRRMLVHGHANANLHVTNAQAAASQDRVRIVRVAQFPSPTQPLTDPVQVLTAIDEIALGMGPNDSAVVLAPAAILTDALTRTTHSREAQAVRSDVLRSDRVRAIVRLPHKLLAAMPRQAQALWVLGAAHQDTNIAERWTMVADLSATELTMDVRQDLVGDLAASMGSREDLRAHSFRFARLVPTRTLLAGSGSLTAATAGRSRQSGQPAGASAAELVMAENLVDELGREDARPLSIKLAAATHQAVAPMTVGRALKDGSLAYLPGHRVAGEHLEMEQSGDAHLRVVGVEEIRGESDLGSRRINQLVFSGAYPNGRLTEPGDVIFATGAQGGAMVDEAGAAVVLYPARILRINLRNPGGLIPQVLARDIQDVPPGHWRKWLLRRAASDTQAGLQAALTEVAAERRRLAVRLQRLDELAAGLASGVVQGSFEVVDSVVTTEGTS